MGRLRSRRGWYALSTWHMVSRYAADVGSTSLTCRKRHVKCDENKPICGQCVKSDRLCEIDTQSQELQVKRYRGPRAKTTSSKSSSEALHLQEPGHAGENSIAQHSSEFFSSSRTDDESIHVRTTSSDHGATLTPRVTSLPGGSGISGPIGLSPDTVLSFQQLHDTSPLQYSEAYSPRSIYPSQLSQSDAEYVHHFAQHLAIWLDCTDASRQFTLKVSTLARKSPILLHAVISFAARHMKHSLVADTAQQKCVELLIPHLSSDEVSKDEAILCAIVILRVCEQLSATSIGSDQERHLSGLGALMEASQAPFELDPSSPTLSQAAFWVFVRQILYNACVNQQSPNLDFNFVVLQPPPTDDSVINVETETAWANTMTWICARVICFCFGDTASLPRSNARERRWLELSKEVQDWQDSRPSTFEPICWIEPARSDDNPFPEILFTSDWHVMAFGLYRVACMLLEIYQAAPRFAIRRSSVGTRDTDAKVMMHVRALCGVTKSSPATVPSLITFCHSTFIWGPLMTDEGERTCVLKMLADFEIAHSWPTAWIATALRKEWYAI